MTQRQLYRYRQQHGVNLGSWFTLEAWLTGSLFNDVNGQRDSEMDLIKGLPADRARQVLEAHWDNFINDGDWQWLQSHGINTVRLPISYYHFLPGQGNDHLRRLMEDTEYEKYADIYSGAWQRITGAIQKAAGAGIGVLIDLHAVPGAQNTDGHSGLSTKKAGLWEGSSASKNQKHTVAILEALAEAVGPYENVVGLELLNEPRNNNSLQSFYEKAIGAIRQKNVDLPLYLSDAWDLNHYSNWVSSQSSAGNFLVIDHHLYRCFSPDDHKTPASEHAARIHPSSNGPTCQMLKGSTSKLGGSLIIGEWSSALNPSSVQGRNQDDCQRDWGQAQAAAYAAHAGGSFFWTLKKEGPPDAGWCLYSAVEKGVLPANLTRPNQKRSAEDLGAVGQSIGADKLRGHSDYWNSRGSSGEHKAFGDGWSQGWRDAQSFLSSGDTIGFYGQWAKARATVWVQQGGNAGEAWEFEHGCSQAIESFNESLRG